MPFQVFRSEFIDRYPAMQYAAAVVFVAMATVLTSGLWLIVDRAISAPLFLGAIVLSSIVGGFRVGVFASLLSGLAIDFFYVAPFYAFTGTYDEVVRLGVFLVEGSLLSWLVEKLALATDQLKRSREELRQLTQYQQKLREDEQKRIALEIHDELGQALTGIKLDVHLIRKGLNDEDTTASGELEMLSKRIDETIGTVRRIASEMRPSILDDFGLVAAIEWQASEFERKSGVECSFRASSDTIDLDPDVGSAVFRIFQEALTNVMRHAAASVVTISVDTAEDNLALRVEDDGKGIDTNGITVTRSLGLIGMRERANRIGGSLAIGGGPNGGTLVELLVPLNAAKLPMH